VTCALLALSGTAGADKSPPQVKVTATLVFNPPSLFSGKVSSKVDACESRAPVSLAYFTSSSDTTADTVASGKANKKGSFSLTVPNAIAGEYEIMVGGRRVHEADGDVDKCRVFVGVRHQF
jgi:hypothetical protein